MMDKMETLNKKIIRYLDSKNITFKQINHKPTLTSEESAIARGEELSVGGKALLIKVDDKFMLFVLSAAKKIDSKEIKRHFSSKKIRFASRDELMDLTGLVPGSVPPFGRPILDFDLYVDESIKDNEMIAFNAGSLTDSVVMKTMDYLELFKPEIFKFSE